MFRLRHTPLVVRAIARWVVGTKGGRKLGAVVAAVVVAPIVVVSSLDGGEAAARSGTWSGLSNHIAPDKGSLTIEGAPGKTATCTVRGKTGSASGSGWVFRGDAKVEEASCEGRIEKNGRVSVALELGMEWRGRVKGIGGDWEDVEGKCTCEGDLKGTLARGGDWKGKCKNDKGEWETSFEWKLDAE